MLLPCRKSNHVVKTAFQQGPFHHDLIIEALSQGGREHSKMVLKAEEEVNQKRFSIAGLSPRWKGTEQFYKLLKVKTEGEGPRVILGTNQDNGWEAWRGLGVHLQPLTQVKEGQATAALNELAQKLCRSLNETSTSLLRL